MVLNKILKPILTPFSKNKWQSRNPEVRKKAILELPLSQQDTLYSIAMNDSDPIIRAVAANRLSDLDLLQTIIMKGSDETVKEAAQLRLFQLLCGLKHPVPEYEIREKMIRGSRNPALLEFVAANADRAELRELTIKRISRDPLLGDIALSDSNSQVRQLAANQIAKRSTLERVAKQSRRKDKRVYKIVKTKLDRIIEDEERPALLANEVLDICDKLEKLNKRNRLLQEKTTFENYIARWTEIQNFANEQVTKRFHSICSVIYKRLDELEKKQQLENSTLDTLEKLLSTLSSAVDDLLSTQETSEPDQKIIDENEKIILNLGREWDEHIKNLSNSDTISQYNIKFQAILDLAEPNSDEASVNLLGIEKVINLVEQTEGMLSQKGYIPGKTISVLETKFKQQLSGQQLADIEILEQRFNQAISALKEQLKTQQSIADKFISQIHKRTETIKSQINDGHVTKADTALHDLFKQIDHSDVLSNSEKQKFHSELHSLQLELGDLSSWRNWAHDNERLNLTLKAEQLVQQANTSQTLSTEFTDITTQIKEIRNQWKKMRSRTSDELWQRFNNACNQAYEKCTPYIDKQAEIRKLNLKAKEALCEQLENYIETMHWPLDSNAEVDHSINWIQVDKITKQAKKEWADIGYVDRKAHKAIKKRFDNAIDIIRNELKKVWHINQKKFQQLIDDAQVLSESLDDDLPGAIHQAKELQKQWKKIGPVSSFQRNKLWKKFRKSCDVIFNKRQESIEQKNSQNTELLREKEAICENLEALNQQPLKRSDLETAYRDIQQLWHELAPSIKSLSKDVNKRYHDAQKIYEQKLTHLIFEEQQHQLDLFRQKADLCTQLESSSDNTDETINDFESQWQQLEKLPNGIETLIQNRYENALHHINDDKASLIESELIKKHRFCLKHEILLSKDSPEKDQQQRMEMQVDLLNSNLGSHGGDDSDSEHLNDFDLQLQWYEMSNYSQDQPLEERFNLLLTKND